LQVKKEILNLTSSVPEIQKELMGRYMSGELKVVKMLLKKVGFNPSVIQPA
jgi:hypothetical protein